MNAHVIVNSGRHACAPFFESISHAQKATSCGATLPQCINIQNRPADWLGQAGSFCQNTIFQCERHSLPSTKGQAPQRLFSKKPEIGNAGKNIDETVQDLQAVLRLRIFSP